VAGKLQVEIGLFPNMRLVLQKQNKAVLLFGQRFQKRRAFRRGAGLPAGDIVFTENRKSRRLRHIVAQNLKAGCFGKFNGARNARVIFMIAQNGKFPGRRFDCGKALRVRHDVVQFAVEQVAGGNQHVGFGLPDLLQHGRKAVVADNDAHMDVGDLDDADLSFSGENLFCRNLQGPDADALRVDAAVNHQSGGQKHGQAERHRLQRHRADFGNDQLVKEPDQLEGNAQKEKQKDKRHPDIAGAGDKASGLLTVKRLQRPDNDRREDQENEEDQQQGLQGAGEMKNASGPEKEIKINSAVKT